MTFRTCSFEKEVSQALRTGHWPDGCSRELRAHVDTCSSCRDLVLVTETFLGARSESAREMEVGSPGLIWWRAQLRRRRAATERIGQPITIAQIFALMVTLVVGVSFVAWQYRHGLHWASWWNELAPWRTFHLANLLAAKGDWSLVLLVPTLGTLVLLSGLALYLASKEL